MEDLQRINVQVYLNQNQQLSLKPFLALLDRWKDDGGWLDIADYIHMEQGPGALLFGKKCFFNVYRDKDQVIACYANRSGLEGQLSQRFVSVLSDAKAMFTKLFQDQNFPQEFQVNPQRIEVLINDRAKSPNNETTHQVLSTLIQNALKANFQEQDFTCLRTSFPEEMYGLNFTFPRPLKFK